MQLAHHTHGVQEKPYKLVTFPMNKQWFFALKSGAKFWEFRRASSWKARCAGASHALFRLGDEVAVFVEDIWEIFGVNFSLWLVPPKKRPQQVPNYFDIYGVFWGLVGAFLW